MGVALKSDGTVWASGRNTFGELGIGSAQNSSNIPVQVPGMSNVFSVVATGCYSYAIGSDGSVWVWGRTSPASSASGQPKRRDTPQPRQLS